MRVNLVSVITMVLLALSLVSCAGSPKTESTGEYLDSAAITAKLKAEMAIDDRTSALQIEVETFKDSVILSGFVDSENEKMAAQQIAEGIDGVESVENALVVK